MIRPVDNLTLSICPLKLTLLFFCYVHITVITWFPIDMCSFLNYLLLASVLRGDNLVWRQTQTRFMLEFKQQNVLAKMEQHQIAIWSGVVVCFDLSSSSFRNLDHVFPLLPSSSRSSSVAAEQIRPLSLLRSRLNYLNFTSLTPALTFHMHPSY